MSSTERSDMPARQQARWARWNASVDQSGEQDFYSTSEAPQNPSADDVPAGEIATSTTTEDPSDTQDSVLATPRANNVDLPDDAGDLPPVPVAVTSADLGSAVVSYESTAPAEDPRSDDPIESTATTSTSTAQVPTEDRAHSVTAMGATLEKRRSEGGRGILARLKRMSRVGTKEEKEGGRGPREERALGGVDGDAVTASTIEPSTSNIQGRSDDDWSGAQVTHHTSPPSPPLNGHSRESSRGSFGGTGQLFSQFASSSADHGDGEIGSEDSYSPEPEPEISWPLTSRLPDSGSPDGIAPLTEAYERGRGGSTTKLSKDVANLSLRDAGKERRPRLVYGFSGAVADGGPQTPDPAFAPVRDFRQRIGSFTPTVFTPGEEGRYPEEDASVYGAPASVGSYFTYADSNQSRIRSVAPSLVGFDGDENDYDASPIDPLTVRGSDSDLASLSNQHSLDAMAGGQDSFPSRSSTPVQSYKGGQHSRSESAGTASGRGTSGFATPVRAPTLSPSIEGPLTFPTRSSRPSEDGSAFNVAAELEPSTVALSEGGSDDSAIEAEDFGTMSQGQVADVGDSWEDAQHHRRPSSSMDASRPVTSLAQNPEFISDAEAARHLSATPASRMFRPASQMDTYYAYANGRPGEWLCEEDYTPQERHYLIRELVQRELQYELDRAWLFGHVSLVNRRPFDEDEYRIFRPDISDLNKPPPRLPLLHFLFTHAFSTFPLFRSSGHSRGLDRAKAYVQEALLPLLRAKQQHSLSAAIDRMGEGDRTFFNARSTIDGIQKLLIKWASRYVTAVLRLKDADGASLKHSSPWPAADLIPPEAYMACRKPTTNALRHGGMEIIFAGMRVRQGNTPTVFACDYILAIRRPNRLVAYVVRNEADFKAYSVNVAQQLGPSARVKVLPPLGVYADSEDDQDDGEVVAPRLPGHPATLKGSSSTNSVAASANVNNRGTSRLRHFSSAKFATDNAGVVSAVPRSIRATGSGSSDGHGTVDTNGSNGSGRITFDDPDMRRRSQDSTSSQRSSKGIVQKKPPTGLSRFALPNLSRSNLSGGGTVRPHESSDSLRALGHAPRAASTSTSLPTLPLLPNKRRRRLRAWLRDTLSVRGAGHASETSDFLDIGAFGDGDLRTHDRVSIASVAQADGARRNEAKNDELEAGKDVLELRASFSELWEECKSQNGLLKMHAALRDSASFSSLPMRYQQLVTWSNMQAARWLHGTFVTSDTSRGNTARARELFGTIPWRKLEMAMRDPTGLMMGRVTAMLSDPRFVRTVLSTLLEDKESAVMREELDQLRLELPKTMCDKLAAFVEADDDLKRIVRDHARTADIPLVAAIVRSAEKPRLDKEELASISAASKAYKAFMATQPSIVRQRSHKDEGYQLLVRLQRVLRLLSILRDAEQVRAAMQDLDTMRALAALFAPFGEALRNLHEANASDAVNLVVGVRVFITRLLDTIAAQRARVVDPVDAINAITTLLDRTTPMLFAAAHNVAARSVRDRNGDGTSNGNGQGSDGLLSFFEWAQALANIIETGSDDLADVWAAPPESFAATPATNGATHSSKASPSSLSGPSANDDPTTAPPPLQTLATSLAAFARRKRNRQAELACRWAAGDTDAEMSIQIHGDVLGRSRIHPFFPREPRPTTKVVGTDFEEARKSFAVALAKVLGV